MPDEPPAASMIPTGGAAVQTDSTIERVSPGQLPLVLGALLTTGALCILDDAPRIFGGCTVHFAG